MLEFVENGLGHGRSELLGRKSVAPANDPNVASCFGEGGDNVEIERFANASRLLGAIQDGNGTSGTRQCVHELLNRKGTGQPNLKQADFFALGVEPFDGFFGGTNCGSHRDNDALGIRRANVIEQVIASPRLSGKAIHNILHDRWAGKIERIACLASLEENVGILRGATEHGLVWAQRAFAVPANGLAVDHGAEVIIREQREIVQFVRSTKTVEKVEKGN